MWAMSVTTWPRSLTANNLGPRMSPTEPTLAVHEGPPGSNGLMRACAPWAFPVKTRNFVRWGHPRTLEEMSTLINLCS